MPYNSTLVISLMPSKSSIQARAGAAGPPSGSDRQTYYASLILSNRVWECRLESQFMS